MADLRKIRVPEGALRVEVDSPPDFLIKEPAGIIRGWFAATDIEIPEAFHFQASGITVPHRVVKRGDVESALPEHAITGFEIPYDLTSYLPYIQNNRLELQLILAGFDPLLLRFQIEENAMAMCLAAASEA